MEAELTRWNAALEVKCEFAYYDEIFDEAGVDLGDTTAALWKLLGSGVGSLFRGQPRGLFDFFDRASEQIRWTAGMVVQWVENEELRAALRDLVLDELRSVKPDVLCAHSLGSLICYDALSTTRGRNAIRNRTFISFGSQIGNPFVRDQFMAGRVAPLAARKWYHLYNPKDDVFTAPISIADPSFEQVLAEFDLPGMGDHDARAYLAHPNVSNRVWRELAAPGQFPAISAVSRQLRRVAEKPKRRALLVGINQYPNPANRLEGCVNDVFRMSAVLQDCGFPAEDIRVLLDRRATAREILERLRWLLDGAAAEDQRVFYYSGHGAQLPGYGAGERVDHLDECLVPFDFDGSQDHAVMDDQLYELYSQLPYETRFVMVLDCCHSGGMARHGGLRARGIDPPDDIRHRMLRWESRYEMWVPRDFEPANSDLAADKETRRAYAGPLGITRRLGRALALRTLPADSYDKRRRSLRHQGPYLPIIIQACQESQYAYEYRHGATSYGAFTYCLTKILRQLASTRRKGVSFAELVGKTEGELRELQYAQVPDILGPSKLLKQSVPWSSRPNRRGRRR